MVGLGIGQAHVYGYTRRRDLFEVVALCDADPSRTATLAARLPGVRVTDDLAEVCAADDIDVVSVCTPPFLHFEQVAAVLRAGKHAVCEKPLVGSLQEVDDLERLERDTGRRVMPIFQYRYGHGLQRLRLLRDAGVTGPAFATTVEVAWTRGPDYYAVPWRGRWATELGGMVLSHCVHALDMATYVLGRPARAFARMATRVNEIETEDCVSASIEMADGSSLTLAATLGSAAEISRHRFCFRDLTAESNTDAYTNSSDPWTFTGASEQASARIDEVMAGFAPEPESYQRQFELVHAALASGGELPVTLADARASLELVTALYASARSGADVDVAVGADHPLYAGWRP